MALERPWRVGRFFLTQGLESLAEFSEEPALVLLDLFFTHMLYVLVGGEEIPDVIETKQCLEGAIHVTSVSNVVQTR